MLLKKTEPDFRFRDERGSLIQLVHQGWKQVNVIESVADKRRGGHYHKKNQEAFYIISGKLKLELKQERGSETHILQAGDMFLIGRNLWHQFYFLEHTVLVSLYDLGVELPGQEKDIYEFTGFYEEKIREYREELL